MAERYYGRDIGVITATGIGSISEWDTFDLSTPSDDFEATAAAAARKQYGDGQDPQAVFKISGFQGDTENAILPQNNDIVTGLTIGVGFVPADLFGADYGVWKVKNTNYSYGKDAAKYSFEIRSNYLE